MGKTEPTPDPPAPRAGTKAVLLVDDHALVRRGLRALLDGEPDLSVCGEAPSAPAALEAIAAHPPDLAIVDLNLEGGNGLDLIKDIQVRHPEVLTLVLSMHDESLYAERALRAGARGYLTKAQLDETVLTAIRSVLAGERWFSPETAARLAAKYLAGHSNHVGETSPLAALSNRELEVFELIGHRLTTRRIAERLGLSVKTIESHRENIKNKLSLGSAADLVRDATRWVDTGEAS